MRMDDRVVTVAQVILSVTDSISMPRRIYIGTYGIGRIIIIKNY